MRAHPVMYTNLGFFSPLTIDSLIAIRFFLHKSTSPKSLHTRLFSKEAEVRGVDTIVRVGEESVDLSLKIKSDMFTPSSPDLTPLKNLLLNIG